MVAWSRWWVAVLLSTALVASCNLGAPVDLDDSGSPDAEGVGDEADVSDADVGPDSSSAGPGPISLVVQNIAVLTERLCDIDGDGVGDNAVADLGSPNDAIIAVAIVQVAAGAIDRGSRIAFHFPWVDDRAGPDDDETLGIVLFGEDVEDDDDPMDDFSGVEPLQCDISAIDACGEPLYVVPVMSIVEGEFSVGSDWWVAFPVASNEVFRIEVHTATGTIAAGGSAANMEVCGYATIANLGAPREFSVADGLTMLEVFLAGGGPLGVPTLPGIEVDLDFDGDGLEGFVLDADGRIETCVDGDGTTIEGRDCWQDPRMMDGISLSLELNTVSFLYAGRAPDWEQKVDGTCEDPPEESLWDWR